MEMNIDYISRETAKVEVRKKFHSLQERCEINEVLNSIPAADVKPVVHGRWLPYEATGKRQYMCSECCAEEKSPNLALFCYHCGADMREDKQE